MAGVANTRSILLVLKEKYYRATSFVGKESKQLLLTNIEFLNKF
jgi:hypothetical protein